MNEFLAALAILLLSMTPLSLFILIVTIARRRQRKADQPAAPAGDPQLREALAASRRAHQDEHRAWEAEFCRLLGARVPSAGDPYNLAVDMRNLHADILATGSLYGPDAVKYLFARGGLLTHADLPDCPCVLCWEQRKKFLRKDS
jgi:hypothetical protein